MAEASPRPGRQRGDRVGAVAVHGRRRRRLGWLWLLIAALVLALLLWAVLRNRGGDGVPAAAASPSTSAAPTSGPTTSATATPSAGTPPPTVSSSAAPTTPTTPTASPSVPSPGAAGPSSAPAATSPVPATGSTGRALVGGGTVPARLGTGAAAAAGTLGTLLFAEGSDQLDVQSRRVLASTAKQIKATGPAAVAVTGYTDTVGGQPVNTDLSRRRADTVAAALRAELGSSTTVVTAAAGGSRDPVAANTTAEGRQLNRRVTVTTSPAAAAGVGQVGTVLFPTGSAELGPQSRLVLAAAAQRIRTAKPATVTVTGYTDTVGGRPTNGALAEQRARAVAAQLRAQLGAAAPPITVTSRGPADPVATNATAEGRQRNRRVTITTP